MTLRQVSTNSVKDLLAAATETDNVELMKTALRSLAKDIQNLTSLLGIGRDPDGSFIVQDFNNTQGRFPNFLSIDNRGFLTLGNNYGAEQNVFGQVKGSFYAVPQWCKFAMTADQAAGNIVWDTEIFNNGGDLYERILGNTRIQIKTPGDYYYISTVLVDCATLIATQGADVIANLSGLAAKPSRITFQTIASPIDSITMVTSGFIQTAVFNDYLEVQLAGVGGGAPGALANFTTLEICKVN